MFSFVCTQEDTSLWIWILAQLEGSDGVCWCYKYKLSGNRTAGWPRSSSQTTSSSSSSSSSSSQQHLQHIQTLNTWTSTLCKLWFYFFHAALFSRFFLIGGTSDCRLCGKTAQWKHMLTNPPSRCPTPGSNMPLLLLLCFQPQPPSPGFTTHSTETSQVWIYSLSSFLFLFTRWALSLKCRCALYPEFWYSKYPWPSEILTFFPEM